MGHDDDDDDDDDDDLHFPLPNDALTECVINEVQEIVLT